MNRKLKFRVWDKLSKSYIKITPISKYHHIIDLDGNYFNLQNGSGKDEYVVEQYTGKCDKNGHEIFEGDILGLPYDDGMLYATVSFYENSYVYKYIHDEGFYYINTVEEHIVVGNINENPELICI